MAKGRGRSLSNLDPAAVKAAEVLPVLHTLEGLAPWFSGRDSASLKEIFDLRSVPLTRGSSILTKTLP